MTFCRYTCNKHVQKKTTLRPLQVPEGVLFLHHSRKRSIFKKIIQMQNSIYIYIWAWGSSNKLGTLLDSAVVPRVVINQSLTLRRTDLLHKSATICFTFTKTFQIPVQHFYPRNPQAAKKEHSKNPICFQQIHGYTMNLSYCDAKNSSLESPQKNFRASLENRKGWMGR